VIGAQAVTYQVASPGALSRKSIPTTDYADGVTLYGSLQPLEVKEDVTNIDYAIEKYHFITPPTPIALAAKATDRLTDSQGLTYRVFGARIKPRANGSPHHVEIMLENPSGLNA
jgi:hypothetical protein